MKELSSKKRQRRHLVSPHHLKMGPAVPCVTFTRCFFNLFLEIVSDEDASDEDRKLTWPLPMPV